MLAKTTFLLLIIFLFSGCARTSINSMTNSDYFDHSFKKILVEGNFEDLDHRRDAEEEMCRKLEEFQECECIQYSTVIFPGEEISEKKLAELIEEFQIDGILVLQTTESGSSSYYVPPTTYTSGSTTIPTLQGSRVYGSSTSTTSGGYTASNPWAKFEVSLISTRSGHVVWYATASSKGNTHTNRNELIRSAAGKAINQLESDGIITK